MDRSTKSVVGFMAGVLAAVLAFGLVYVARTLATCYCLNGSNGSAPLF